MSRIIARDRSIILACDVQVEKFEEILKATDDSIRNKADAALIETVEGP